MPTSPRRMQCEFTETRCKNAIFYCRADVGIGPYEHKRHRAINWNSSSHTAQNPDGQHAIRVVFYAVIGFFLLLRTTTYTIMHTVIT